MDESMCEKFREMVFEAEIDQTRKDLAKKGATQDEIDDYIYSLRCIEELNNKYFAN